MALLNYVDKLSNAGTWNSSGDYRLIFTGDGHITTHGIDYTALFTNATTGRGLVTSPAASTPLSLLTSKNEWRGIESDASKISTNTDFIPTVGYVHQYLSIVDVMKFKGVITQNGQTYEVTSNGSTTSGFPKTCEAGDTYRVSLATGTTVGQFAGKAAQSGDLLICTKDSTACENTATYWVLVHTNIHGEGSLEINGSSNKIIFYGSGSGTIYAPTQGGTAGYILQSNGTNKVPTWVDVQFSDNKLYFGAKEVDLSSLKTTIGALTLQIGGTTQATYSGSTTTFNIPIASSTALGVVKIGDHIISNSGTISVPLVDANNNGVVPKISGSNTAVAGDLILVGTTSDGAIWKKLPIGVDTWRSIFVGSAQLLESGTDSGNLTFVGDGKTTVTGNNGTISITSTWRDVKVGTTSIGDNALTLKQGSNITLANNSGTVTISATDTTYTAGTGLKLEGTKFNLLPATSNDLGGIQLGFTNTDGSKKYAVQVDSNNKAYVEVPWQNENTWREILVDTKSIDKKDGNGTITKRRSLKFMPSEEIHIIADNTQTTDIYELSFGLQWYNISKAAAGQNPYEYV